MLQTLCNRRFATDIYKHTTYVVLCRDWKKYSSYWSSYL